MMSAFDEKPQALGYQLFILVLCIYAFFVLLSQLLFDLDPRVVQIFNYGDSIVCIFFLLDFLICMIRAPKKWHYFIRWGWIDLISAIPTFQIGRWGRAARFIRIVRIIRGIRATRTFVNLFLLHRNENAVLAVGIITLMLIISSSIAILQFETTPDANIRNADDAIWWAITTITTVGYGDRYPVTFEGRIVAVMLMCAGVGLFGTFSGILAAWFLTPQEDKQESELEALRKELVTIRTLLEQRHPLKP